MSNFGAMLACYDQAIADARARDDLATVAKLEEAKEPWRRLAVSERIEDGSIWDAASGGLGDLFGGR
jgi:hypothetical protein